MKTDRILIVADNSSSSIKAIRYGFSLAEELKAKVALLYVIEPGLAEGNVDAGIFPDDALKKLRTKARSFLQRIKKKYGKDIDIELMTPYGEISTITANIAKDWDARLLITGTHGRTGLSKLLNGSVAESIIHNSPVPVCVVQMDK